MEMRPEHPAFNDRPGGGTRRGRGLRAVTHLTLTRGHDRPQAVLNYLTSMSWVAELSPLDRSELLRRTEEVLERHNSPSCARAPDLL